MDNYLDRLMIEHEEKWQEWNNKLPYFCLGEGVSIKPLAPTVGAIMRFRIKKGDRELSIYFDAYDKLARMGVPYWEIYGLNGETEDVERYAFEDIKGLNEAIERLLNEEEIL